jgi:hypothetical protein
LEQTLAFLRFIGIMLNMSEDLRKTRSCEISNMVQTNYEETFSVIAHMRQCHQCSSGYPCQGFEYQAQGSTEDYYSLFNNADQVVDPQAEVTNDHINDSISLFWDF